MLGLPLLELDVSANGFGAAGGLGLAELIGHSSNLQRLALSDNPLFDYPAEALGGIAEAVGNSSSLTHLEWRRDAGDLGAASMGREARVAWGVALARMLRTNSSLTHVDLAGQPVASSKPDEDPEAEASLRAVKI